MEERIQKLMARAGVGSRRESEKLIREGRVQVNNRVAKLGDKADPSQDKILVDGRLLKLSNKKLVYIALNKPKGVISSLEDELNQGRRTIRELIDVPGHLYPVGRLDRQSTGLMLMTNDGDLAHRLTHPRFGHEKMYNVVVEGRISPDLLRRWRRGVRLDGRKTVPARIRVIQQSESFTRMEIVMREGRKRQIRRIANMLGHPVRQLVRERIGTLTLDALKPGEWRYLNPKEITALKKAVASNQPRESHARVRPPRKGRQPH
jgi:pseudouridine synthase